MKRLLSRYSDLIYGVAPLVLTLIAIFLVQRHYGYVRTSIDKTVASLQTGTMYLLDRTAPPCAGDAILFASEKMKGRMYYRRISGVTGVQFNLSELGYELEGKSVTMHTAWREKAAQEARELTGAVRVPDGHVLIVNDDYDAKSAYNNWAFEILPRKFIRAMVTHILFSRQPSQIGERVAISSQDCARESGR